MYQSKIVLQSKRKTIVERTASNIPRIVHTTKVVVFVMNIYKEITFFIKFLTLFPYQFIEKLWSNIYFRIRFNSNYLFDIFIRFKLLMAECLLFYVWQWQRNWVHWIAPAMWDITVVTVCELAVKNCWECFSK